MRKYGEQFKNIREYYGITQYKLAKDTNISQQNISRWEHDKAIPSIAHCEILADYYGIPLDELVGRTLKKNW